MAAWANSAAPPSFTMMAPPPPGPASFSAYGFAMQQAGYIFPPAPPPPPPPPPIVPIAAFPELLARPPPPEMYKMPEGGNLEETANWLENLCTRTENGISQVKKMTGLESTTVRLVSCPFDSRHRMPPHALLLHWLRCPLSPAGLALEAEDLVSSLSYLQPGNDQAKGLLSSSSSNLWYEGAPGPVQISYKQDSEPSFSLPPFVKDENLGPIIEPEPLLPSQFWLLTKEVEDWVDIPESYSSNVLNSAMGLDRMEPDRVIEWLLDHSCEHGIVLDPVLASHILVVVTPFLRLGSREAGASFGSGNCGTGTFKCPVLYQAGNWLVKQLACLYHETQAAAFTLRFLKFSLTVSARKCCFHCDERGGLEPVNSCRFQTAMRALHERKGLEILFASRARSRNVSKSILVDEYDSIVKLAAEERLRRPDYKPVLEHDGLVWQREKEEDTSRIKTGSDLLAAERDYKRRPLSYRGKKQKRSASEVMHDMIEKHMAEIVAAGGTGQVGKITAGEKKDHWDTSRTDNHTRSSSRHQSPRSMPESRKNRNAGRKDIPEGRREVGRHESRKDRHEDGNQSRKDKLEIRKGDRSDEGHKRKREGSKDRWDRHDDGYHSLHSPREKKHHKRY